MSHLVARWRSTTHRPSPADSSEYLADCDKRRAYISNFDGSAGVAVVTAKEARLWTDGRYWLQASQQLSK